MDENDGTPLTRAKTKRRYDEEVERWYAKQRKVNEGQKYEFDDLCDNVLDMILLKLSLKDLINISDTSTRLRKLARSVFVRKFVNRLLLLNGINYSPEVDRQLLELYEVFINLKQRPSIELTDAKSWFKLLRNFGEFIKFLHIFAHPDLAHKKFSTTIPIAMVHLNEYVQKYCSGSLELLKIDHYPYFTLNKPLPKLNEFLVNCCLGYDKKPCNPIKHWDTNALEFLPNVRALHIHCFPHVLKKSFPQVESATFSLNTDDEVNSFVKFIQLNPQIVYLKIRIGEGMGKYDDLIFSTIETHLKLLKVFRIIDKGNFRRDETTPNDMIPIYRFNAVESLSICSDGLDEAFYAFEFINVKKLQIKCTLNQKWMNFMLKLNKLNVIKILSFEKEWVVRNGAPMRRLINLPELRQIVVQTAVAKNHMLFKRVLGYDMYMKQIDWKLMGWKTIVPLKFAKNIPIAYKMHYQRFERVE